MGANAAASNNAKAAVSCGLRAERRAHSLALSFLADFFLSFLWCCLTCDVSTAVKVWTARHASWSCRRWCRRRRWGGQAWLGPPRLPASARRWGVIVVFVLRADETSTQSNHHRALITLRDKRNRVCKRLYTAAPAEKYVVVIVVAVHGNNDVKHKSSSGWRQGFSVSSKAAQLVSQLGAGEAKRLVASPNTHTMPQDGGNNDGGGGGGRPSRLQELLASMPPVTLGFTGLCVVM